MFNHQIIDKCFPSFRLNNCFSIVEGFLMMLIMFKVGEHKVLV